jgi:hypothetical protein
MMIGIAQDKSNENWGRMRVIVKEVELART